MSMMRYMGTGALSELPEDLLRVNSDSMQQDALRWKPTTGLGLDLFFLYARGPRMRRAYLLVRSAL